MHGEKNARRDQFEATIRGIAIFIDVVTYIIDGLSLLGIEPRKKSNQHRSSSSRNLDHLISSNYNYSTNNSTTTTET